MALECEALALSTSGIGLVLLGLGLGRDTVGLVNITGQFTAKGYSSAV